MAGQLFIKIVDLSARALTVVVDSESDKDDGGLVATSSSVDDTANAEARDEVKRDSRRRRPSSRVGSI